MMMMIQFSDQTQQQHLTVSVSDLPVEDDPASRTTLSEKEAPSPGWGEARILRRGAELNTVML